MDSMIEKWRHTLKSSERKSQHTTSSQKPVQPQQLPPSIPSPSINQSSEKKSAKKKKNINSSQRLDSPPRATKSHHIDTHFTLKSKLINDFVEQILSIKSKNSKNQLQMILDELWSTAESFTQNQQQQSIQNSNISSNRIQNKIYTDLENKYFALEKEKQGLKVQLQEFGKKYEGVERENGRLLKIEKLVDGCLKREEGMGKEIEFLRAQLKAAEERDREQQAVFKKEVLAIHGLIEAIKESLPE